MFSQSRGRVCSGQPLRKEEEAALGLEAPTSKLPKQAVSCPTPTLQLGLGDQVENTNISRQWSGLGHLLTSPPGQPVVLASHTACSEALCKLLQWKR